MLGGADNPNGELPSYITGADRGERFPSLAGMERWQWQDMPFWQVIAEASLAAKEAGHAVREMERWMVPNKLREVA